MKKILVFMLPLLFLSISLCADEIMPSGALEAGMRVINVEAFQYGYSPDPIVVRKGETVLLKVTSRDVTHGFYISEYDINATIKKGALKEIKFSADKKGEFAILCSVYCGSGHAQMRGKLLVIE